MFKLVYYVTRTVGKRAIRHEGNFRLEKRNFSSQILMYLRMCLAHSAGATPNLDTITSMEEQAPLIAAYVRQLISDQPGDKSPVFVYIDIIKQLLNAIGGECGEIFANRI